MDTKFKKEEFVILPDGEVGQILEVNYKNKKDFYKVSILGPVYVEDFKSEKELKKWNPVAGEFCWFRSVHGSAEFGIFSGMRDGKYQMHYSKELTGLYNFSYCEPFRNQFPTFMTK